MAKRRKHADHEEHENHERWLITYADMITLLMVLFIVLFSMSQVDLAKFQKLKASFSNAFGGQQTTGPLKGGDGALSSGKTPIPMDAAVKALATERAQHAAEAAERIALNQTKQSVSAQLAAAGVQASANVSVERRGLVVNIASDKVLFDVGQATLTPAGAAIVDRVAVALASLPNAVRVEGHTDNVPISGTFPSNWELSTARATTVLRELEAHGVTARRLSATGYADQRPVASNDTPDGRARNRRVAIVVEAMTVTEGGA